jgi:hypothetical protein
VQPYRERLVAQRNLDPVFVTLYAAYATLDGITIGLLLHAARDLPADQQATMHQFIMAEFSSGELRYDIRIIAASVYLDKAARLVGLVLAGCYFALYTALLRHARMILKR